MMHVVVTELVFLSVFCTFSNASPILPQSETCPDSRCPLICPNKNVSSVGENELKQCSGTVQFELLIFCFDLKKYICSSHEQCPENHECCKLCSNVQICQPIEDYLSVGSGDRDNFHPKEHFDDDEKIDTREDYKYSFNRKKLRKPYDHEWLGSGSGSGSTEIDDREDQEDFDQIETREDYKFSFNTTKTRKYDDDDDEGSGSDIDDSEDLNDFHHTETSEDSKLSFNSEIPRKPHNHGDNDDEGSGSGSLKIDDKEDLVNFLQIRTSEDSKLPINRNKISHDDDNEGSGASNSNDEIACGSGSSETDKFDQNSENIEDEQFILSNDRNEDGDKNEDFSFIVEGSGNGDEDLKSDIGFQNVKEFPNNSGIFTYNHINN